MRSRISYVVYVGQLRLETLEPQVELVVDHDADDESAQEEDDDDTGDRAGIRTATVAGIGRG